MRSVGQTARSKTVTHEGGSGFRSREVDRGFATLIIATLIQPMRVALGLAKITDIDFDLTFDSPEDEGTDQPSGTARVSLFKFGERMSYEWWDFKRMDSYRTDTEAPSK